MNWWTVGSISIGALIAAYMVFSRIARHRESKRNSKNVGGTEKWMGDAFPIGEIALVSTTIASMINSLKPEADRTYRGINNPFYKEYSDPLRDVCVFTDRLYDASTLVDAFAVDRMGNRFDIRSLGKSYRIEPYRTPYFSLYESSGIFEMEVANYINTHHNHTLSEHEIFEVGGAVSGGEQHSELGKEFSWLAHRYISYAVRNDFLQDPRFRRISSNFAYASICFELDLALKARETFRPIKKYIIFVLEIDNLETPDAVSVRGRCISVERERICVDLNIMYEPLWPPWIHDDIDFLESRFPVVRELLDWKKWST